MGIGQDNQQGRSVRARVPDSITRYEASAICVSRTGISVSSGAVLQVFIIIYLFTFLFLFTYFYQSKERPSVEIPLATVRPSSFH